MEALLQPPSVPGATYLGIQVALDVVAAGFVCLRVTTNRIFTRRLGAEDYTSILAVVFLVSYSVSSYLMTSSFVNPDITVARLTKISAACVFTGGAAMYFSKVPLLFLYTYIFGIKKWLRVTCYVILAVTAIVYLVCAAYAGYHCVSPSGAYDEEFLFQCSENTFTPALVRCFTAIFTDIIILAIPLTIITKLHLPRARKTGLAVVFLTGILALVAACISLYYQWQMMETSSPSDMTIAMLCTCIECCIAIVVGCAPALNSLWTNYIAKTAFAKRFVTPTSSLSTKNTNSSQIRSQRIQVTTHQYLELDDYSKGPSSGYEARVTS